MAVRTYLDPGTAVDPDVRKACAEVVAAFPKIPNVWGYSASSDSDHRNRRCIDYMVIGQGSDAARIALGNAIAAYHIKHAKRLGVNGVIWNHRVMGFPHVADPAYRGPYGEWRSYSGSNQHTDHVHVEYDGTDYVPLVPWVWDGHSFPGADRFFVGARGDYVTLLGRMLVKAGFKGYSDGPGPVFSTVDQAGVKWFQEKQGWSGSDADGFPGAQTWTLLEAIWNEPDPTPPKPPKPPVPPVPQFSKVVQLDAPGGGNWQGAVQNVVSGEWFIAHSRSRDDGLEDVVLYRFDKTGKYRDQMTLPKCSHVLSFGVSDTNVIWLTWNDKAGGNDVVTLQYKGGTTITKAKTSQMHVFTDRPASVSFSPTRYWVAIREKVSDSKAAYRLFTKSDVLAGRNKPWGKTITVTQAAGRTVQGFSVSSKMLYILIGLAPGSAFRIEKWSFATGKKVGELKLSPTLGLASGERAKVEPEGMDGHRFGMKVGEGDSRRMIVYELNEF